LLEVSEDGLFYDFLCAKPDAASLPVVCYGKCFKLQHRLNFDSTIQSTSDTLDQFETKLTINLFA